MVFFCSHRLDRGDQYDRDRERRKRKLERHGNDPSLAAHAVKIKREDDHDTGVFSDAVPSSWAAETARRSLKRMVGHMNVGQFNVSRSGTTYASRDPTSRSAYGGTRR